MERITPTIDNQPDTPKPAPAFCPKHGTVLAPMWTGVLNQMLPNTMKQYGEMGKAKWVHELCPECERERSVSDLKTRQRKARIAQTSPFGEKFDDATFENYTCKTDAMKKVRNEVRSCVSTAISGEPPAPRNVLFLCGNTGTGKTHLMESAFKQMAEAQCRVLAFERTAIIHQMKTHMSISQESGIAGYAKQICSTPLLLLDDFEPRHWDDQSQADREIIFELFNTIYKMRTRTIITSNIKESDFKSRIGKPAASRFTEMREKIIMSWGDKREEKRLI